MFRFFVAVNEMGNTCYIIADMECLPLLYTPRLDVVLRAVCALNGGAVDGHSADYLSTFMFSISDVSELSKWQKLPEPLATIINLKQQGWKTKF